MRGEETMTHDGADGHSLKSEEDDRSDRGKRKPDFPSPTIVLVGAMGSGKTTVGWLLARLLGYGFIDLDGIIERREGQEVEKIFEAKGEAHYRELERQEIRRLAGIKCHVVSVGGGAVIDEGNWQQLQEMGVTIWMNPPPAEIARRLLAQSEELKKRPLLADILEIKDREERLRLLAERLSALIGQRQDRYKEAQYTIEDTFSTPEISALQLKTMLLDHSVLRLPRDRKPFDKWQTN